MVLPRGTIVLMFTFYRICRRILSISPHKDWSTPSEIFEQRIIHNRYIAQLRVSFLKDEFIIIIIIIVF